MESIVLASASPRRRELLERLGLRFTVRVPDVEERVPAGYEALVAPRSSTFSRYGVLQANSVGIMDNSYRGNGDQWCFPAYATRDTAIEKGARICQFRILRNQPELRFLKVETLDSPDRGGFGSTGV